MHKQLVFWLSRNPRLWLRGIRVDRRSYADAKCVFRGRNRIFRFVELLGCDLGFGTYISERTRLESVRFGPFCSVGRAVESVLGSHPTNLTSTHPAFFSSLGQAGFSYAERNLVDEYPTRHFWGEILIDIGPDVWIGQGTRIMNGVQIGVGAVVGAGSLVTKDVAPYSIVVGVPARVIRYRFDDNIIGQLLSSKWWNDAERIYRELGADFNKPEVLLDHLNKRNRT